MRYINSCLKAFIPLFMGGVLIISGCGPIEEPPESDLDVLGDLNTTVGAMVAGVRINSGATFYANGSIKGKMIPYEQLPPEVQALMIR